MTNRHFTHPYSQVDVTTILLLLKSILYWTINISKMPLLLQQGMWNDVRLTEHRLQIRASDIKVHNRWLNVNSSTSGPSFITKWSHRITHRIARAVEKAVKLNILFMARRLVGSWKPVPQHVPCHISRILPGRTWRQTSHVAGGCVPTDTAHPLCRRLAAIQRNRQLAEVGRTVKLSWSCRRQCVTITDVQTACRCGSHQTSLSHCTISR